MSRPNAVQAEMIAMFKTGASGAQIAAALSAAHRVFISRNAVLGVLWRNQIGRASCRERV